MTEKERIEKFKSHNLVVNCRTEEEARKFIDWCYNNGIKWKVGGNNNTTNWHIGQDKTIYRYDGNLVFWMIEKNKKCEYEIMTYQEFFKEDKMSNLEYVIKSIKKNEPDCRRMLCDVIYEFKNKTPCCGKCPECEFSTHINVLEYLAEKHNSTIKVTQFEYDLLNSMKPSKSSYKYVTMYGFPVFTAMKHKGYFKNIESSMKFCDVYERMEVSENV